MAKELSKFIFASPDTIFVELGNAQERIFRDRVALVPIALSDVVLDTRIPVSSDSAALEPPDSSTLPIIPRLNRGLSDL